MQQILKQYLVDNDEALIHDVGGPKKRVRGVELNVRIRHCEIFNRNNDGFKMKL